jgi:hypothetical protein
MALRTSVDYYANATGANFPNPAFDRPRELEYRRHRVQRDDVPRVEQPQPMGAERAGSELAGWALRQPSAARGLSVLLSLLHGVEQRAADCLELHRCGRLGRPDGGFVDQGILDNGTTTVRGPVGCGDAGGHSNIDPAPFIDTDGRAYLYFETGHNASGAAAAISVIKPAPDVVHAVMPRTERFTGTQAWEQRGTVKIVEGLWMHRHRSR